MAKILIGGRPDKAALGRMKVVTVVVSVMTFLGSLGVIAGNGVVSTAANGEVQASQVALTNPVQSNAESTFTGRNGGFSATQQQPGFSAPVTRSRGS